MNTYVIAKKNLKLFEILRDFLD
ncbi:hypothetical protein MARI151_20787 [Maribacter litoralis]|uniref:Uncharacterized protein n=1 Tax=Maribacter litoralis TaxID=2059726 RepID=A0A653RD29_9FLAO|nr:hypothetical protein MARI151_20787 [Maribacter litoralis]